MREVRYQLTFEGKVSPEDEMGSVMRVETRASFGAGVDPVFATGAPQAVVHAMVEPDDFGGFRESGEIIFGGGTLTYVSDGEGKIGESADPTLQQGHVVRRIEGGSGAFEGASGVIVSVFTVSEDAQMRDSQSAVIFLTSN
ncbi:hypothetical protein [Parvibaculum sp.]|uniref:hypothetical protein n=1 Tax=Parvibaculum sp. TaxID=2024848 RepID=UPI003C788BAD